MTWLPYQKLTNQRIWMFFDTSFIASVHILWTAQSVMFAADCSDPWPGLNCTALLTWSHRLPRAHVANFTWANKVLEQPKIATGFPWRVNNKSKVTRACYKQYWNRALQPNTLGLICQNILMLFHQKGIPFSVLLISTNKRGGSRERWKQQNETDGERGDVSERQRRTVLSVLAVLTSTHCLS